MKKLGVNFSQKPTKMGSTTVTVFDDTCGNLIQIYHSTRAHIEREYRKQKQFAYLEIRVGGFILKIEVEGSYRCFVCDFYNCFSFLSVWISCDIDL